MLDIVAFPYLPGQRIGRTMEPHRAERAHRAVAKIRTTTKAKKMLENASANNTRTDGTGVGPSGKGAAKPAGKTRARSAATSGRRAFVEGDGNSRWARRYRDLTAAHVSDLGGVDLLSQAQLSLIRRASAIEVELEQMEGKLSLGRPVDLDVFTRSASHLRRLWETLGLKREPRDVTMLDGQVEVPFSPMHLRWAEAEAAAKAKEAAAE
jgi:hypothetical protein